MLDSGEQVARKPKQSLTVTNLTAIFLKHAIMLSAAKLSSTATKKSTLKYWFQQKSAAHVEATHILKRLKVLG